MKHFVFFFRLAMYAAAITLPLAHPGIALYLDTSGAYLLFFALPAMGFLAYFQDKIPKVRGTRGALPIALIIAIGAYAVNGLTVHWLITLAACAYAYALTRLVFFHALGQLLYLEPLALFYLAWRVTSFSRSSHELAAQSTVPNALITLFAVLSWIAYALVIYALLYHGVDTRERSRKGYRLLAFILIPLLALSSALVLLRPQAVIDYVQNLDQLNPLRRQKPRRVPNQNDGIEADTARQGRGPRQGQGGQPRSQLYESDRDSWSERNGSGSGDGNQYLVMVVESPVSPLYLADSYLAVLEGTQGFLPESGESLNQLTNTPFLETWTNPEYSPDFNRQLVDIEVYSTISAKVSSYRPFRLEPTVRTERHYPLRYSYRATSQVSRYSLLDALPYVEALDAASRERLETELAVPTDLAALERFRAHVASFIEADDGYSERIEKILKSFSVCQYQLGISDDVSIEALEAFLFSTKHGDCSEFSNAAALLGRLAGVASRVVTGYVLSRDLQSESHIRGLYRLRDNFAPLSGKDISQLYLITTAHRHSWVQFYLPGAGWIDFESTKHAIPPEPGFDPNTMDLVIPEFRAGEDLRPRRPFPFFLLLQIILATVAASIAALYLRRWLLLAALAARAHFLDEGGLKARYRLLLLELSARGYAPKGRDETPKDYAARYPELETVLAHFQTSLLHPDADARMRAAQDFALVSRTLMEARGRFRALLRLLGRPSDGGLL